MVEKKIQANNEVLKKKLVKTSRLLHRIGYVAGSEGNISVRISENFILIKAADAISRMIDPADFVQVDIVSVALGELLSPKPSSELPLHQAIYVARKDINSIIHSHPSHTITASPFLDCLRMIEPSKQINKVPVIRGYKPGSIDLANAVASQFKNTDVKAVILERHGLVATGNTLEEAFDLTQIIEKNAYEWETLHIHDMINSIANHVEDIERELRNLRKHKHRSQKQRR
jgi:L-fuculose-phosphate aldolase